MPFFWRRKAVVQEEGSMGLENLAVIVLVTGTEVASASGETETICGAVLSIVGPVENWKRYGSRSAAPERERMSIVRTTVYVTPPVRPPRGMNVAFRVAES